MLTGMPLATTILAVALAAALTLAFVLVLQRNAARRQRAELEKTQVALARAEKTFRLVIENAPVTISFHDRAGCYRIANPLLLEWLKKTPSEVIGKRVTDVFGGDVGASLQEYHDTVMAAGRSLPDERLIAYPDGVTRYLMGKTFPVFGQSGEVMGTGTVGVDISELKETQRRLEKSQRMEAVGQLTGGVAHDFNNVLTVIGGNLELLEGILEADDKGRRVAMAMRAVERGAELTQRLLSFARRQQLNVQPINLSEVFEQISALLRRTLREDVRLAFDLADDLPSIANDPLQLETAIVSLAVNAQEAMPTGGELTLRGWHDAEADEVCVEVIDTGTGIAPEIIDRVYEPFFTTKEFGAGAGLGLSTVYGFVRQSGGVMAVDSVPGQGTTVTLRFPVAAAERPSHEDQEEISRSPAPLTVMVVEDEEAVRDLVCEILRSLGHRVFEAGTGTEALALFEKQHAKPDLILSDMVLPGGVSGQRIVEGLRTSVPTLPAIVMSGYAETLTRAEGELPRDVVFLPKPFDKHQLASAIAAAMGSKPPVPVSTAAGL